MNYRVDYSYVISGCRYTDFIFVDADNLGVAYDLARIKLSDYHDSIVLLVSPACIDQFEFDFFS